MYITHLTFGKLKSLFYCLY